MDRSSSSPQEFESLAEVDGAMYRLLKATLREARLTTARDEEIAALSKRHAVGIDKAVLEIASLESQIEKYHVTHLPTDKKSVQLANGLMGMRAPSNPGLVPLSDAWPWLKIKAKVKLLWKDRYFHKPPASLDKVKLKKDLDAADLKKCGLALDASEHFYYELNRLAIADPIEAA